MPPFAVPLSSLSRLTAKLSRTAKASLLAKPYALDTSCAARQATAIPFDTGRLFSRGRRDRVSAGDGKMVRANFYLQHACLEAEILILASGNRSPCWQSTCPASSAFRLANPAYTPGSHCPILPRSALGRGVREAECGTQGARAAS
jgi:hypothetical protein